MKAKTSAAVLYQPSVTIALVKVILITVENGVAVIVSQPIRGLTICPITRHDVTLLTGYTATAARFGWWQEERIDDMDDAVRRFKLRTYISHIV